MAIIRKISLWKEESNYTFYIEKHENLQLFATRKNLLCRDAGLIRGHNSAFQLICSNNVANKLHVLVLLSVPADCDRVASLSSRFYDLLIWYYRFYELNCPSTNRFVNHNSYLAKGQGNSMTYIVFPLRQLLLSSTLVILHKWLNDKMGFREN